MTLSLLTKLAIEGISKRRTIYFPYFLAVVLIMALEYIMVSLIFNDYVQTRHPALPTIIMMAVFFSTLLIVIFILYANNFIQRQRRLEFSLYTVLGLEGKHIRGVIFIEQLLTAIIGSVLSVGIGFVFGKLVFMGLNRLIRDAGAGLSDYPFNMRAALITTAILLGIMLLIFIINSLRLSRLNPSELLSQVNAGEAEPKSRWFLLLIGLVTLAWGYYIALTTTDVLDALMKVFVAIFLVIIATYALLTSLSIISLKLMKKNKDFYYKPVPFLSISGMLYRMKANATSLATIAILCTGIVLTLGTTLTLYLGMDEQVARMTLYDFELNYLPAETELDDASIQEALQQARLNLQGDGEVEGVSLFRQVIMPAQYQEGEFQAIEGTSNNRLWYIIGESLDDFNNYYNQNMELAEDEVLLVSTSSDINGAGHIQIAGQDYRTQLINLDYLPMNMVGQITLVVFPEIEDLNHLIDALPLTDIDGNPVENLMMYSLYFNAKDGATKNHIEEAIATNNFIHLEENGLVRAISGAQTASDLYMLNGGFLFLGIIVGLVLIIGTVLMLYFKQVSEGYQDQEKYQIMRKVGLPENLIKPTIRQQIFWVFALPIMIAVIHSLFAGKIMYSLLGIVGIVKIPTFLIGYGSVLLIFIVVYLLFYAITSRAYYRIINQ